MPTFTTMATCRKCGKTTASNDMTLDPHYKMVVCKGCSAQRKAAEASAKKENAGPHAKQPIKNTPTFNPGGPSLSTLSAKDRFTKHPPAQAKPVASKPAGWDEEDELLERAAKKKATTVTTDSKYSCPKCRYVFTQNSAQTKQYHRCPFCGTDLNRRA